MNVGPKELSELIARQMDSGWGADSEQPLTRDLIEKFAACDLLVLAVIERLVTPADHREWGDIGCRYGLYGEPRLTREGGPDEDELGAGRRRLAEAMGAAHDLDLELRCQNATKYAVDAANALHKARSDQITSQTRAQSYAMLLDRVRYCEDIGEVRRLIHDQAPEVERPHN